MLCRMISGLTNALELEWLCLREIFINVNKLLAVLLLPVLYIRYFCIMLLLLLVYFLNPWCCYCLFIPLFYTDVVAVFLFICWSCKQVHYFCFWSFCLSFLKHYFHFRNNILWLLEILQKRVSLWSKRRKEIFNKENGFFR